MKFITAIGSILLSAVILHTAAADVVETKTGARLVGKVVLVDGISVVLDTDYAGQIKIKQSEVTRIATDAPLNVRLQSGTVMQGTIDSPDAGKAKIDSNDGAITTSIEKIALTWPTGAKDPALVALERRWSYQAGVDVTGKTGNSEQLGTAFSFRATLEGPGDKLLFYSGYDRQVSEGEKSADQFKAGVDYENNFSGRMLWYIRDEAGFDRVKAIEFYNISAAGFGYHFIKNPVQTLSGRAGISHRFESYRVDPVTALKPESLNSAGLDFGLNHEYKFKHMIEVNRITYVPTFEDFDNYVIDHESFVELPMANPAWKLRMGVSNNYNSMPPDGRERLDTTYFTRLILNWR